MQKPIKPKNLIFRRGRMGPPFAPLFGAFLLTLQRPPFSTNRVCLWALRLTVPLPPLIKDFVVWREWTAWIPANFKSGTKCTINNLPKIHTTKTVKRFRLNFSRMKVGQINSENSFSITPNQSGLTSLFVSTVTKIKSRFLLDELCEQIPNRTVCIYFGCLSITKNCVVNVGITRDYRVCVFLLC